MSRNVAATRADSSAANHRNELRSVKDIRPLSFLPQDPLAEEVIIPDFQAAVKVDCMVRFPSSEVLASRSPGLANYIAGLQNSFRLIITPLLRAEDQTAIEDHVKSSPIEIDDWFDLTAKAKQNAWRRTATVSRLICPCGAPNRNNRGRRRDVHVVNNWAAMRTKPPSGLCPLRGAESGRGYS